MLLPAAVSGAVRVVHGLAFPHPLPFWEFTFM